MRHFVTPSRVQRTVVRLTVFLCAASPVAAAEWQTPDPPSVDADGLAGSLPARSPADRLFPGFGIMPTFGFSQGDRAADASRYAVRLGDKVLLGIESGSVSGGSIFGRSPRSVDYGSSSLKLGYAMSSGFTPYLSSTVQSVRPSLGSGVFVSPFEAGIAAQNPAFAATTAANVGAGFNYALGEALQIGVGVTVGSGSALIGR